jgi:hypothetical protein
MKKLLLVLLVGACGAAPSPEASSEEGFGFPYCYDYKHCTSSAQCPNGQVCWGGDCRIPPMNTRCETYEYDPVNHFSTAVARNAAGDRQNCVPYVCNPSTGSCADRCTTSGDCAPGYACDAGNCNYYWPGAWLGTPPTAAPDREMAGLCSNACGDRAGKSYETCYNGYWIPSTTRCNDNQSMLYWGYYYDYCGAYSCNWVRGYCNSECGTSGDCSVGYYCDYDHICKYPY